MEKQQDKQKLTVEGQVQDMKEKDIKIKHERKAYAKIKCNCTSI